MRRGAPPPQLRVDPSTVEPWSVVSPGPRGLRLASAPPPAGDLAPGEPLRVVRGAPFPSLEIQVVSGGALALIAGPGLARTVHLPRLAPAFDRRPPGIRRVVGAPDANAGLLLDDAGWRAVVLPSLGDMAADLGPGPLALRADARRLALVDGGVVEEFMLPGGEKGERVEGSPRAMAYGSDGRLVVSAGAGAGPVGTGEVEGSPIVALAAASAAPRVLGLHEDGSLSLFDLDGARVGGGPAPLADATVIGLSADGTLATLANPASATPEVAVARADDGAWVRRVEGAKAVALAPEGALLLGGDWGLIWLEPPKEEGA